MFRLPLKASTAFHRIGLSTPRLPRYHLGGRCVLSEGICVSGAIYLFTAAWLRVVSWLGSVTEVWKCSTLSSL